MKHRSVLALQRSALKQFLPVLPSEGLGVVNSPPEGKQLGTGGGQLGLHRGQGGRGGFLILFRFSQR